MAYNWPKKFGFFLAAWIVLFTAGCAPPPPMLIIRDGSIQGLGKVYRPGDIVQLPEGKIVSFTELVDILGEKELVFVGEVHADPEHHLIQTQILQALAMRWGRLDVAMEFLPAQVQGWVDRFVSGKSGEEEFLSAVNWTKVWGFPFHLYRPLFLVVKREGGRILAINAPHKIVRKVARNGLSSLSKEERALIAREIDLSHPRHRKYLKKVFDTHAHGEIKNFEYFYQAQCVWEDTMAENIARWLMKSKRNLVVLTGNGHILNRYGIPDRASKRAGKEAAIVVPIHIRGLGQLRPDSADFVWVTGSGVAGVHKRRK